MSSKQLVHQQLVNGRSAGELVEAAAEAAEITERSLIAVADALGVRTQRGQWWLRTERAREKTSR